MKLTISQEGMNPITIKTASEKNVKRSKSTESLDPELKFETRENEDAWLGPVTDEIRGVINKNKKSIYDGILEFGLKYVKWFCVKMHNDIGYAFNGKDVNKVTKDDIAKVINANQKNKIYVTGKPTKQKVLGNSALFAVHFEWKVDPEHGACVLFDKNAKAFAIRLWSEAWDNIHDWEIKEGLALHR